MSEDSSEKDIEQCSIKEYICDGCDIVFCESDKLLLHYLQHHDLKDEEITFDCANCYKSFPEQLLFAKHLKQIDQKDDDKIFYNISLEETNQWCQLWLV